MKEPAMANSIWFPFYMGDYLSKTAHLSQAEHGAYICLMLHYYINARPIPHSRRYSICRAFAEQEQAACDAVLDEYFTREGDVWCNARCEEELAKARDISEKRANAARSRGVANAQQMHSNCIANGEQKHTQSQSQSQLHNTATSNPPTPQGGSDAFKAFVSVYPKTRADGREKVWDYWRKNGLDSKADEIMEGLQRWLNSEDWRKEGGRYHKGTLAWLRAGLWQAHPKPATSAQAKTYDDVEAAF